jgi:hypothetical protein
MKKWGILSLVIILIHSIQHKGYAQEITLIKKTHFSHFPSASSIEYYNNRLYVFGDDAPKMLVLDNEHNLVDSMQLFPTRKDVMKKGDKADLESSFLFTEEGKTTLVAMGSFSSKERREIVEITFGDKVRLKDVKRGDVDLIDKKIKEPNIEGATLIGNKLVLANRANKTHRTNYLLVSNFDGKDLLKSKQQHIISVNLPITKNVRGVSGLSYIKDNDLLLFTLTTEKTDDSIKDGEIGESYLGIIYNVSTKIKDNAIKPDRLLPLSQILETKEYQKIEAVTVESGSAKELLLHLTADNDNGKSNLFKIKVTL